MENYLQVSEFQVDIGGVRADAKDEYVFVGGGCANVSGGNAGLFCSTADGANPGSEASAAKGTLPVR